MQGGGNIPQVLGAWVGGIMGFYGGFMRGSKFGIEKKSFRAKPRVGQFVFSRSQRRLLARDCSMMGAGKGQGYEERICKRIGPEVDQR